MNVCNDVIVSILERENINPPVRKKMPLSLYLFVTVMESKINCRASCGIIEGQYFEINSFLAFDFC
jgi:hypothetical protein